MGKTFFVWPSDEKRTFGIALILLRTHKLHNHIKAMPQWTLLLLLFVFCIVSQILIGLLLLFIYSKMMVITSFEILHSISNSDFPFPAPHSLAIEPTRKDLPLGYKTGSGY